MDTLGEGLDAFESEIGAHPVLEIVQAYPEAESRRAARAAVRTPPLTFRRQSSALVPAVHDDGPPVIRVAMAGVPRWARRVRVVPAIALALWTAAGISVGAARVLTLRVPAPVPVAPPPPRAPRPAAAPVLLTVIVEPVPEPPARE